jgi:hypothetical protein
MTMAFIRSLVRFQLATAISASSKPPIALFPCVDLEEAATNRAIAVEWVDSLKIVAKSLTESIAEAEARGLAEEADQIGNVRWMLSHVLPALEHAEEHVVSFGCGG